MPTNKVKTAAQVVLYLVLAGVIAAIGHKTYVLLEHVDAMIQDTQQRVKDVSQNTNAALIQIGLMADQGRRAAEVTARGAEEQRALYAKTAAHIEQSAADLEIFIRRTDSNLNASTLPEATALITELRQQTAREGEDVHAALTTANARISDPNIQKTLAHVESTAASADKTAQDLNKAIHDSTHPTKVGQTTSGITVLLRILSWFLK